MLVVEEYQGGLINVIANDTDADGDYPLTLVSISDSSGAAYMANGTQIGWYGEAPGTYYVSYTVRDARGATATGQLTIWVKVSQPNCGTQFCFEQ
jgi:hypothetical protein